MQRLLIVIAAITMAMLSNPSQARRGHNQSRNSSILVSNDTGTALRFAVAGQVEHLYPGETERLRLSAGSHTYDVKYELYDSQRRLVRKSVHLQPGETERVVLRPPKTATVQVVNQSDLAGTVRVDGRSQQALRPAERREIQVPVGRSTVSFEVAGRAVDSEGLRMGAFDERTLRFDPVLLGDLLVKNPLPVSVTLTCSKGYHRTIRPYGSTVYEDLRVGTFTLKTEAEGRNLGTIRANIQPFETTRKSVQAPDTGFVKLSGENHRGSLDVYVDGRRRGTLDGHLRLELGLGRHTIEVRSQNGRIVLQERVSVDAFDTTHLVVRVRHDGKSRNHDSVAYNRSSSASCSY